MRSKKQPLFYFPVLAFYYSYKIHELINLKKKRSISAPGFIRFTLWWLGPVASVLAMRLHITVKSK